MLEAVCGTVRRLQKFSSCAFQCDDDDDDGDDDDDDDDDDDGDDDNDDDDDYYPTCHLTQLQCTFTGPTSANKPCGTRHLAVYPVEYQF